jgi:hypothetical protein
MSLVPERLARLSGGITASVLALLGLIHLYWAAGGSAGSVSAIPERGGRPLFRPSPASTRGVAGLLFAAACVLLTRAGLLMPLLAAQRPGQWHERWAGRASWLIATLFALRAVGDFRYVGVFKRVRGTPFARWDSRLFTPLCILIALGCAIVAAAKPSRRT